MNKKYFEAALEKKGFGEEVEIGVKIVELKVIKDTPKTIVVSGSPTYKNTIRKSQFGVLDVSSYLSFTASVVVEEENIPSALNILKEHIESNIKCLETKLKHFNQGLTIVDKLMTENQSFTN